MRILKTILVVIFNLVMITVCLKFYFSLEAEYYQVVRVYLLGYAAIHVICLVSVLKYTFYGK